ncbi:MAG: metalloregulator ArsR/SmtB family transcription factor [Calditrichota bacterium]
MRLAIIDTLADGERNVSDIQESIGEPQAITSQHLRLMERRNILSSRKEGVQVFYHLRDVFITKILECVRSCGIE